MLMSKISPVVRVAAAGFALTVAVGLAAMSPASSAAGEGLDAPFNAAVGTAFTGAIPDTKDTLGGPARIYAVAAQADGKLVIGGYFTAIPDKSANYIGRVDADGTPDTEFVSNVGTGFNGDVGSIAIQDDQKIVVGGGFTSFNGTPTPGIVRLNPDGTLDTAFSEAVGSGPNLSVAAISIDANQGILVGGWFWEWNGVYNRYLVRLNSDGTRDVGFSTNLGAGPNNRVVGMAVQADHRIVIVGEFTKVGTTASVRAARISATGVPDAEFGLNLGAGFNNFVNTVAVAPDQKIVIGGEFTMVGAYTSPRITRLNADGTPDTGFILNLAQGASPTVNGVAVQPNGKVLIVGQSMFKGVDSLPLLRLAPDGQLDTGFSAIVGSGFGGGGPVSVRVDDGGRILVVGTFSTVNGASANNIVRFLASPDAPTVPLNPQVTEGDGQAEVSWTKSASDGGAPIEGYTVVSEPGGKTCTTTVGVTPNPLSCTVTGLTNGTAYKFAVRAQNVVGDSGPATTSAVTPLSVPSSPTSLYISQSTDSLTFTWQPPTTSGGTPVTAYVASTVPPSGTCSTINGFSSDPLTCTIVGIDPAVSHTGSIVAINLRGESVPATAVPELAAAVPPPQQLANEGEVTDGAVIVSWTPPASMLSRSSAAASIKSFRVDATPGGKSCSTHLGVSADPYSCAVTGLSNGTRYTFTLIAINDVGESAPSRAIQETPKAVPSSVRSMTATPANGRLVVAWLSPDSSGGAPITGYRASASPGSANCVTSVGLSDNPLTCTISGLTNGTPYRVEVVAANAAGRATTFSEVVATPRTVPSSPRLPSVTFPAAGRARVVWVAPASTGGAPVTSYEYCAAKCASNSSWRGTGRSAGAPATAVTLTGLTKGRSIAVQVRAVNAAGHSPVLAVRFTQAK